METTIRLMCHLILESCFRIETYCQLVSLQNFFNLKIPTSLRFEPLAFDASALTTILNLHARMNQSVSTEFHQFGKNVPGFYFHEDQATNVTKLESK